MRGEYAVEVTRGGEVESVHQAVIAVTNACGEVRAALGCPQTKVWIRSAAKPI